MKQDKDLIFLASCQNDDLRTLCDILTYNNKGEIRLSEQLTDTDAYLNEIRGTGHGFLFEEIKDPVPLIPPLDPLAVIDYISGMTDVYALDVYQKICGISLPIVGFHGNKIALGGSVFPTDLIWFSRRPEMKSAQAQ